MTAVFIIPQMFIRKGKSLWWFFTVESVCLRNWGLEMGLPTLGPLFLYMRTGLFKDTVNQATRSREGAMQGEQWRDGQVKETLMES